MAALSKSEVWRLGNTICKAKILQKDIKNADNPPGVQCCGPEDPWQ
jgi:hypothetical protein